MAAGDYLCNLEAATNTTTYPGTYKALLAGADRVPGSSDWVLQANQPYKNQRGYTIGTTDANAKLPAVLDFSIGDNDDFVWSGFDADWGVSNNNCGTWASGNAGNGTYGTASALTYFSEYSSGYLYTDEGGDPGTINCYSSGNASRLYCVQQ